MNKEKRRALCPFCDKPLEEHEQGKPICGIPVVLCPKCDGAILIMKKGNGIVG